MTLNWSKKMSNQFLLKDLCIVVLESPYLNLSLKEARDTFSNMIDIKIKGYLAIHGEGAMPVDTTDFIATHLIVADKNNPFENIHMSYKSISYKTCEKYNVPFPFMTLLQNNAHPECVKEMQQILMDCKNKNEDLSYDTGWTINPAVRENKMLQTALKEITTAFAINHHADYDIAHWVTLGICKVKTDQHFLHMGLKEISKHSVFQHPYLHQTDSRAVISQDGKYSDYVYETAKKYQSLWDERITINMEAFSKKTKVAA
jgi:hypothetical protein